MCSVLRPFRLTSNLLYYPVGFCPYVPRKPIVVDLSLSYQESGISSVKARNTNHFDILKAKIGNTPIARARVAPFRKDVLMKSGKMVGGGDKSRKTKLLQKQKRGKARAKTVGRVSISQEAFWSVLQRQ